MIKRLRNAVVLALLLPLASLALAESRPGSGARSSFRSGFSSQKSSPAKKPDAVSERRPSFGSFGSRRGDAAAVPGNTAGRSDSATSRELGRGAAQEQALRNYDASRARPAPPPLPPLTDPVMAGGNRSRPGGDYRQETYSRPAAPPVIVRDSGSKAWLWGIGGYLLGRSATGSAHPVPAANPPIAQTAGADHAAGGAAVPAPVKESGMVSAFTWAALLVCLGWVLYFGLKRVGKEKKHVNYTFERN